MRWPWSRHRQPATDRLIVAWSGQDFTYLHAQRGPDGAYVVDKLGHQQRGSDEPAAFLARLQALGLTAGEVHVMLRPDQYQLLQIEMPAVPAEELRSAARYQIRDMVDTHLDDLKIDVIRVGDGQQKGNGNLYVVTATNALVRELTELAQSLRWNLTVIDIQDTAQRNLQTAAMESEQQGGLANAALMVISERQALLTISANGELFYSRRLDLPDGFLQMDWSESLEIFSDEPEEYTPVPAYEPAYGGLDSYDYSATGSGLSTGGGTQSDRDRAQRFLVEVQRSLDLWDRTWAGLPLAGLRVFAADRSLDLSVWLSQEMGQAVGMLDVHSAYPPLKELPSLELIHCLPLLGTLLRSQDANS